MVVERAYSMNEAAELMRISRRALQEVVKSYPFYYPNGKRKLFTESDILRLREALRQEGERKLSKKTISVSSRIRFTDMPSSGGSWAEVQRRLAEMRGSVSPRKKSKR